MESLALGLTGGKQWSQDFVPWSGPRVGLSTVACTNKNHDKCARGAVSVCVWVLPVGSQVGRWAGSLDHFFLAPRCTMFLHR